MEIMQLNYFKAVAQYGSFTKAADVLHVTQSALSRSIAALEQDIGFPLFERKGNHIFLTMDGQAFLTAAIEALNLLSSSVDATRARAGLEYGAVRIGIAESVFLKNIVRDFLLEHPNVHIFCKILSEGQIQRSLEEGEINFAVTRERPVGPDDGSVSAQPSAGGTGWRPFIGAFGGTFYHQQCGLRYAKRNCGAVPSGWLSSPYYL